MEDDRKSIKLKNDEAGTVKVSEEVICIVAGLAAMEVEGVSHMVGKLTKELIAKAGVKDLSKGVTAAVEGHEVRITLNVVLKAGYTIPDVAAAVQERVTTTVETMTGLKVSAVDIKISSAETD
ncbi:MAG: Asp23/Gls24 family envelope stress response protein [Lachnospiraceae bacterium]|nr:Asp23/Gls24 family envelope stress response protein [Lachnospiraceae bacterium]